MREFEPNLRTKIGRRDFIKMLSRKINIKDDFPMSWYEILKRTYISTKEDLRSYENLTLTK